MPPPDTGGSAERTRLAWRRTSLSATVAAILLLRLALNHPHPGLAIAVSALAALSWVTLLVLSQRRVRALPATLVSAAPLVLTTAGCLCLGLLGVVLIAV